MTDCSFNNYMQDFLMIMIQSCSCLVIFTYLEDMHIFRRIHAYHLA